MYDCGCEPQQCCCDTPTHRHFLTTEEEIENLKKYKEALEKEIKGVQERIHKMTK